MNSEQFDDLTRLFAATPSRRQLLKGLVAAAIAAQRTPIAGIGQTVTTIAPGAVPQVSSGQPCPYQITEGMACHAVACPTNLLHVVYNMSKPCYMHPTFVARMTDIESCAVSAGVTVHVTSAYRPQPVKAKCSAHISGRAIDMYLSWKDSSGVHECRGFDYEYPTKKDDKCKTLDPTPCLCPDAIAKQKESNPGYPPAVFTECLSTVGLTWGGTYTNVPPDVVHIDDRCVGCNTSCWKSGVDVMKTTDLTLVCHCGTCNDSSSSTTTSVCCPNGQKVCSDGTCHQCCVDSDCAASGVVCCNGQCLSNCAQQQFWCNCNKTCYTDLAKCTANCTASLACFTGICAPAQPGQCP